MDIADKEDSFAPKVDQNKCKKGGDDSCRKMGETIAQFEKSKNIRS